MTKSSDFNSVSANTILEGKVSNILMKVCQNTTLKAISREQLQVTTIFCVGETANETLPGKQMMVMATRNAYLVRTVRDAHGFATSFRALVLIHVVIKVWT